MKRDQEQPLKHSAVHGSISLFLVFPSAGMNKDRKWRTGRGLWVKRLLCESWARWHARCQLSETEGSSDRQVPGLAVSQVC